MTGPQVGPEGAHAPGAGKALFIRRLAASCADPRHHTGQETRLPWRLPAMRCRGFTAPSFHPDSWRSALVHLNGNISLHGRTPCYGRPNQTHPCSWSPPASPPSTLRQPGPWGGRPERVPPHPTFIPTSIAFPLGSAFVHPPNRPTFGASTSPASAAPPHVSPPSPCPAALHETPVPRRKARRWITKALPAPGACAPSGLTLDLSRLVLAHESRQAPSSVKRSR